MLDRAKKTVALRIMTLLAAVILLPFASIAATSPTVSVLDPLGQGLRAPVKMALDAAGNLFVADARIGGIVKYNAYGVRQTFIPTPEVPNGLAFAQDGTLLVSQGASVVRYDASTGLETGRLAGADLKVPAGIAIDESTGYIYVADGKANQVVIFTASGNYVKAFAQGVTSDEFGNTVSNPLGKLSAPTGITYEKVTGQFAVADTYSNRVQFFDKEGVFVKSIGNVIPTNTTGSTTVVGSMQFEAPVSIAFEYSKGQVPVTLERIYVVDSFQGNIQVVNPVTSGALLVAGTTKNYIGSSGTRNGQLTFPADAVFDVINNRLMVVNGYGNITSYGIDGGTNPTDTIAPAFSVDQVSTVYVPNVTVSGTVEAGAVVSVEAGAPASAGTVVYTSPTTWKSDVTGLVSGANAISVSATDAAGNRAAAQSVSVTFQLQLPAPNMSVTSVPGLTNVPELLLSGLVDNSATVTVINKMNSVTGSATVVGTTWTYRVSLAEGANRFAITAQKTNSAVAEAVVEVVCDSVPPALEVSALSSGSYTSTQVQNITGKATDASDLTVLVNDVAVVLDADGVFSVPVSLVTGENVIKVEVTDLAGNIAANTRTLVYDAAKPQIHISNPMDNSYTNNAGLLISGSVNESATIIVAGQSVPVDNNNNWFTYVNLVDGLNTIEVVATDLAGNSSALKRTVTLDTANPALSVSTPVQDVALNQQSINIAGVVNDTNDIALSYSINGTVTPVVIDAGNFSFTVDFAAEAVYPVAVTATDLAGNATTVIRNIIYDKTPPLLTLDAVKWQAHAVGGKLVGTVDAGSTVTVREGTVAIGRVTVDNGKWTADLSGLTYNQTKLSVEAIDAAGNKTIKSIK